MNKLKLATKTLSWTLKFEGDAIKAPDIKPAPDDVLAVKSTLEGSLTVAAKEHCKSAEATPIPLTDVPEKHTIVAIVIKLEGTLPKDFSPLHIYREDPAKNIGAKYKALPDENQSLSIVYFKLLDGKAAPTRDDQLYVINENGTGAKLSFQIAYI